MKILNFILYTFPVLVNCSFDYSNNSSDNRLNENIYFRSLWYFCTMAESPRTTLTYKLVDNKDGTISYLEILQTISPSGLCSWLSSKNENQIKILKTFKKCLQGQVFRIDHNDCKGLGNSETDWGTQKFQFCPTNNRECDYDYSSSTVNIFVADKTKSPAAISCDSDKFLEKTWQLYSYIRFNGVGGLNLISHLIDIEFWSGKASSDNSSTAIIYKIEQSGYFSSNYIDKSNYNYVLCEQNE